MLGGQGLLLIPSVFIWPEIAVYGDEPWPKAIVYPARGVATLLESEPAAAPVERARSGDRCSTGGRPSVIH